MGCRSWTPQQSPLSSMPRALTGDIGRLSTLAPDAVEYLGVDASWILRSGESPPLRPMSALLAQTTRFYPTLYCPFTLFQRNSTRPTFPTSLNRIFCTYNFTGESGSFSSRQMVRQLSALFRQCALPLMS